MEIDVPYFLGLAYQEAKKTPAHLLEAPGAQAVGAVLISQRGQDPVITAYSGERGEGGHAEQVLLAKAREQGVEVKNATVVLTLEPCGQRTDPARKSCAQLLIDAGIDQVFFDRQEPKPDFRSRLQMQHCGIKVSKC